METIEAIIRIEVEELRKMLEQQILDRHTSMVKTYGEACTKTTAAKLINCSVQTISMMMKDGRIMPACGGTKVDVRSLADYIENRGEKDRQARTAKRRHRKYV